MNLDGKVAIVTGAGSGIGKASALEFAKAGASVAVLSHTPEEVQATADEIVELGGESLALSADIADAAQMERADHADGRQVWQARHRFRQRRHQRHVGTD